MQLVSAANFKSLNRSLKLTKGYGLGLYKQMIAPAELVGAEDRALRFTISTGVVDREQDRVALAGWDLANFKRNPVVLWGHDASRLPIGRAFDIRIEDAALKASVRVYPERHARSRSVRRSGLPPRPGWLYRRDERWLPPDQMGIHARPGPRRRRLVSRHRF